MGRTRGILAWLVLLALVWPATAATGQSLDRRFGTQRGAQLTFEPRGPGVLFDALDPALKKWYVPQELYVDYGFRQWEYSNYARDLYQRYVNTNRQGGPFYDLYGNYQTWGWLIFDWNQTQPGQFGSSIYKDPRFNAWFNAVTVSADSRDQYYLAITIGERIRTALDPTDLFKAAFQRHPDGLCCGQIRGDAVVFPRQRGDPRHHPCTPAQHLDQRDQYDGGTGHGAGGGFCQGRRDYGQCPPLANAGRGV